MASAEPATTPAAEAPAGPEPAPAPRRSPRGRRLVEFLALAFSFLLVFRTVVAEPYGVPTGSMAPNLLGNHKAVDCPRCGYPVKVGVREDEPEGAYFANAFCPNCGCTELGLEHAPVCRGDQLLVNKTLFDWVRPKRWEMAVFRCPVDDGKAYVKRVVGLPGEAIEIRDGDVYIDGQLARKTLAEARYLRLPVHDLNYRPKPDGWKDRWQEVDGRRPAEMDGDRLLLDAADRAESYYWIGYHNPLRDGEKSPTVKNEYSYNGGRGRSEESVHDFLVECDVEVARGDGWLALALRDGRDEVVAELPFGSVKGGARLGDSAAPPQVRRAAPERGFQAGRRYHVEFAFVDRRASLAVDGTEVFAAYDLPAADGRGGVLCPLRLGARGVEARVGNLRLCRDVHYVSVPGGHGTGKPVVLGAKQYFVLGDNSPNSDDNRLWSDGQGNPVPVPEASFLGHPFLVHLPAKVGTWKALGRDWEYRGVDWARLRRLH